MTSPVVVSLEKLVLGAIDFDKLKAGILAGTPAKELAFSCIDVAGLSIGLVEQIGEPLLANLCSKNAVAAGLEAMIIPALNSTMETYIKAEIAKLEA